MTHMEAEKLTPLEEKWQKEKLDADSSPKKTTLDDAYTVEGKVANEGLSKIVFNVDNFESEYFMVSMEDVD